MRLLKHGIKSLIRRPVKTVMLFTILVIVFNLVFTGFIIQNSIDESKDYIRYQIGAAVEYQMDYTSAMVNGERPPELSIDVAEKIGENKYVDTYFITENSNVSSENMEPVETQESGGGFIRSASDFTLSGSNKTTPLDFEQESVTLVEGEMLSEDNLENGDYVVLISEDLANENNLRIGDTVSLEKANMNNRFNDTDTETSTFVEDFEIIGIYEAIEEDYSANTLFASLAVTNEINGTSGSDATTATIIYLLDDPMNVEQFKEEVSPLLTSEYHTLYSNDDTYEELTAPLDLISLIATILIWVVFIAGAAIILAIVTIFVRDRKYEIGLLLSSGEGKVKIVSQFILEMVVVAVIAFVLSVGTSNIASNQVSNWIVENQLVAESSSDAGMFQMRGQRSANTTSVYGDVSMDNVADEFNVSISSSVMINLLFVSMGLVLIGSTIPLSIIMSYNPKKILQDY
ncbi:MAG: ABC transporter permease [Eubacteriaceae bacterium]